MSKELDEVAKRRSLNTWKEMMGEDLLRFMNDDDIFEIRVNPDAKIWVSSYARGTYCTALTANFTKVQQVIRRLCADGDHDAGAENRDRRRRET